MEPNMSYSGNEQTGYAENPRDQDDPTVGGYPRRGEAAYLRQSDSDPLEGNTSQRENLRGDDRAPGLGGNMDPSRGNSRGDDQYLRQTGDDPMQGRGENFRDDDDTYGGNTGRSFGSNTRDDDRTGGYGGGTGRSYGGTRDDDDQFLRQTGDDSMQSGRSQGENYGRDDLAPGAPGLGNQGSGIGEGMTKRISHERPQGGNNYDEGDFISNDEMRDERRRSGGGLGRSGNDPMEGGTTRETRSSAARNTGSSGDMDDEYGRESSGKKGDSTIGKMMEKVGGMMGSHKVAQSGIDKREDEANRRD